MQNSGVSVSKKGTISYFQSFRQNERRRFYSFGRWPGMKLKEATDIADGLCKGIQLGGHPHDERDKRIAVQSDLTRIADNISR